MPWTALLARNELFYPKSESLGLAPIGLEKTLRMYIAQPCFGLFADAIEEALCGSEAARRFVGADIARDTTRDATALRKFCRLLEDDKRTMAIFEKIVHHLVAEGLIMRGVTTAVAALSAARSSTNSSDGERDSDMDQTKKGDRWHFGIKTHIGVKAESGLTYTLATAPADTEDVSVAYELLHTEEKHVFGDASYQGGEKRDAPKRDRFGGFVALRPGK